MYVLFWFSLAFFIIHYHPQIKDHKIVFAIVGMLLGDASLVGGPIKHFFASLHLTVGHAVQRQEITKQAENTFGKDEKLWLTPFP